MHQALLLSVERLVPDIYPFTRAEGLMIDDSDKAL